MALLETTGLSKSYGATTVISRLSLVIERGDAVAVTGPNGSGKSTLLELLGGVLRPTAGKVLVEGIDTVSSQFFRVVAPKLGIAGQRNFLYRDLSVRANLALFARLYGVEDAQLRIEELGRRLGIERVSEKRVRELSLGTARRVALLRALLHRPQLLLLDEPFANLDTAGKTALLELLAEHRNGGGTIVFSSHEPELIGGLTARTIELRPAPLRLAVAGLRGA